VVSPGDASPSIPIGSGRGAARDIWIVLLHGGNLVFARGVSSDKRHLRDTEVPSP